MSTPSRSLYPEANLEQLKRQAKELKRAVTDGDAEALERARTHLSKNPTPEESLSLRDAQHVLAREYGFASWGDLLAWHASESSQMWRRISANRDSCTHLMRILEDLHAPHAQLLMSTLSRQLGHNLRVDLAFVDSTTYGEYVMSVSNPTCGWVFEADGLGSSACLDIGMPVARRILGRQAEEWDGQPLAASERARIEPLAQQILEDLRVVFQPAGQVRLRQKRFYADAAEMEVAHAYDVVYLIGYEVGAAGSEPGQRWSFVSLAYPITAVTPMLETLQAQVA